MLAASSSVSMYEKSLSAPRLMLACCMSPLRRAVAASRDTTSIRSCSMYEPSELANVDLLVAVPVGDVRAGHALDRRASSRCTSSKHLLLARQGDLPRVHQHVRRERRPRPARPPPVRSSPVPTCRAWATASSTRSRRPDGSLKLTKPQPPFTSARTQPPKLASAPDLLQFAAAVDDTVRRRVVEPYLDIVGVVAAQGRFDLVAGDQCRTHATSPRPGVSRRPPRSGAQSP